MSEPVRPPRRFHHVGLRALEPQPDENEVTASKCWVTSPLTHPNRIEFLRYEADSPIDPEFMDAPHIAYEVDELEPQLAGRDVYLQPFEVGEPPFARVAFTREDGLFVEYMQFVPGRRWFNE
ncbi:MAG: hypothetical protein IT337_09000 [Thermomicrobiales bacterium]|nr:hypothetical protein [Thermomicrobiales bacterium]